MLKEDYMVIRQRHETVDHDAVSHDGRRIKSVVSDRSWSAEKRKHDIWGRNNRKFTNKLLIQINR